MSFVVMYIWNPLKNLQLKPQEQTIMRLTEYPKLERTKKDQSPIPSPAQDNPINSPLPGSIVQTLPEPRQALVL